MLACLALIAIAAPRAAAGEPSYASVLGEECRRDHPWDPRAVLERISTGWRPLLDERVGEFGIIDERRNARVIYETFRKGGHSNAMAFAAIVNAWAESKLDNTAVMDDPFDYFGKPYPDGSGAIGLFQLLPSKNGAGGPSGPAEGYPRVFQNRRYAGTAYQARRWSRAPDARGRTYYDATNALLNTQRILLEIERDGSRLLAAEKRGASIAELTHLFARDIERPQGSTWHRRQQAVNFFGRELALAKHPARLFAPDPPEPVVDHAGAWLALDRLECASAPLVVRAPPAPRSAIAMVLGAFLMVISGFLGLVRVT